MATLGAMPTTRAAAPPKAVTPVAFVNAIVAAYEARGLDPSEALRQAQIAPSLLGRPGARVSAAQIEAVSAAAMQELDDEAPGWFTRRLPWGSYGMLARASLSAPDLGVALQRWCRHHGLLTDDITLALAQSGDVATVTLSLNNPHAPAPALREFCLVSTLRNVHGYACWLVDSRIPLREVRFPFAAPPHRAVYPLLFPGAVHFDAALAALAFDARYLALPIRRDERALRQMLQRALPLLVQPYRRDRLLVQRVQALLAREPGRMVNAETLAQALHLSVRTLHRQLHDEGAALQGLKDAARRDHALALLARTRRPVKQVAAEAGFRSDKSFARAFRGWTGLSPSEWRRQAGHGGLPAAPGAGTSDRL